MGTSEIYELVYASVSCGPVSRSTLELIHRNAGESNRRRAVSGLLLFFEATRRFVQILEGDKDLVLEVMEKIHKDQRHDRIHILWQGSKPTRSFPDWNMSFALGEQEEDSSSWTKHEIPSPEAALNESVFESRGVKTIRSLCEEHLK